MKRLWLVLVLVLAFALSGVAQAEEKYNPGLNHSGTIGDTNRNWRLVGTDKVQMPEITAPSGHPDTNFGWLYVKDNAGASTLYFENDAGTVTQVGATATAWDDLTSPDANKTHAFTTFTSTFTGTSTAADQWTFQGRGNFGDVSIVKIEQTAGNPTDGTVLEVVSADPDADALLVTANAINTIQVAGSGNLNLLGGTGTVTFTDWAFTADGLLTLTPDLGGTGITITPSAGLTTGLDVSNANITNGVNLGATKLLGTTAVIDFTNFDVSAAGAVTATSMSVGTFYQDALLPASASPHEISINGLGTGGVEIGTVSTGTITLGGGAVLVNLPANTDLTLAGGVVSLTDTANGAIITATNNTATTANLVTLVANAQTSGNGVSYSSSGAVLTGAAFYAGVTDGAGFTGYYFRAYDGAADDFSIKRYGATVIAGNAKGTDALTLTNGDILVISGHIDITSGNFNVAEGTIDAIVTSDIAHSISRNLAAAGSAAVLTVAEVNASSTQPALAITNAGTAGATGLTVTTSGTGNSTGTALVHTGDLATLAITAGAARTGDVITIDMANQLAEQAILITGAMTSKNGEGVIEVHATGVIPAGATLLRLDADTAQPGDGDGYMLNIDDDTLVVATTPKYAVLIDSANNEALHVATGKSLFDEVATFTLGIDCNAGLDVDLAAATDLVNITNAAADLAAGSGVLTVYGSNAAGQTNASYLIRAAWKADGDVQDGFLLFEDNSTGAAANGDVKLKVGTNGTITMGAGSTGTGGAMIYSWENLTIANAGTAASIVQTITYIATDGNGDEDNCTLADGTVGQIKIFVTKTEGAGGDTYKITPANMKGGTKITFTGAIGSGCTMIFDGTSWNIISHNGGTIS